MPRKRPAARVARAPAGEELSFSTAGFDLAGFCRDLLDFAGLQPTTGKTLRVCTIFSGLPGCSSKLMNDRAQIHMLRCRSGAPSIVLGKVVPGCFQEVFACEKDAAACHCLQNAVAVDHLFEDAGTLTGERAWCMKHGQNCVVPSAHVDLLIAGFTCKANSTQNAQRWSEKPSESKHFEAFLQTMKVLQRLQPKAFVLENVPGVMKADGADAKETVNDVIMTKMAETLPTYSVEHVCLTARPLPTERQRIYWIGHHNAAASAIKAQVEQLSSHAKGFKVHHVSSFVVPSSVAKWAALMKGGATGDEVDAAAVYAGTLQKARDKAKGRLPAALAWPRLEDTESRHLPMTNAWSRAQVDVYEQICLHQCTDVDGPRHWVADIGQTAGRGAVRVTGLAPTFTTSSRPYSYSLHRELSPEECMWMHGFRDYNFHGTTLQQARSIIGNGMAATTLAVVLIPVAHSLGALVKVA